MKNRMTSVRALAVLLYALGGISFTAFLADRALQTVHMPFAGILPFANLYVGAFTQKHWDGGKLGLQYHDRVIGLTGTTLQNGQVWKRAVSGANAIGAGALEASIIRGGQPTRTVLPISFLSARDVFNIFGPLFGTGLAFFIIGALAALILPAPPGILPFLVYCSATGVYFLTAYDFHTTYEFVPLLLIAYALVPASAIHLSFSFPRPLAAGRVSRRLVTTLPYLLSALIIMPYVGLFYRDPVRWVWSEYALFIYLSGAYLWWLGVIIYRARRDADPAVRTQCRVILVPLLPAFGTIFVATWLVFVFDMAIPLNWAVPVCLVFPGAVAYAMLRRNLFLVDHLETQIQERTDQLRKTENELGDARKLAAVGLLAAGTAHEIGNAMNVISSNIPVLRKYSEGLLKLVESGGDPKELLSQKAEVDYDFLKDDLPELLANLERGASRAIDIAADLKTFARPPSEEKEPLDMTRAIEMTLRLLRAELGPRIHVEKRFEKVPCVLASAGQIHQVLLNLILNAAQAIEGEGMIEISLRADEARVITSIRDTGRGMSKDQLQRIFEPFFSTKSGGTGLGLSVSYGIVQAHGGKVTIESEVGKGTTVHLILPREGS